VSGSERCLVRSDISAKFRGGTRNVDFVNFKELLGDEEVAVFDHSSAYFDGR
jgi:hypothetical protein